MKKRTLVMLVFALVGFVAMPLLAQAEGAKPLQLALFNPIQLVPEDEAITGLRLNLLYTSNTDVTSLDLGLGVNRATGNYKGVQFALVNWNEMDSAGLQLGLLNYVKGNAVGLQYAPVNVVGGDLSGVQWGFVNWVEGSLHGMQYGCLNVSKGESEGLNVGIVNYNQGVYKGFMLGLVNYADSLHGLQIGLVNYNGNKDPMEYMVLANWSF